MSALMQQDDADASPGGVLPAASAQVDGAAAVPGPTPAANQDAADGRRQPGRHPWLLAALAVTGAAVWAVLRHAGPASAEPKAVAAVTSAGRDSGAVIATANGVEDGAANGVANGASAPQSIFAALAHRVQPSGGEAEPPPRPLPRPEQLLQRADATPGTPEARLLRVYALLAASKGEQALEEARKLAQDVPTFSLAHLVYADLLKARAAPLPTFGAATLAAIAAASAGSVAEARDTGGVASAPAERLKDLSAEARARVGGAIGLPAPGLVPSQFVFLSPTVRHAIAVDASRSRLYLFDNTPDGLVLRRDHYASVGKLGTAKRVEGDLRTPLGVYFVTGRLAKAKLADRYGASAMVLNYPNQYDLLRGRTGSGIWLHGVESSYFSRAPQATDGCVALSNPDLLTLADDVDRQATPVVIADRIDWVKPAEAAQTQGGFTQAFEVWRHARQQADPSSELALYAGAGDGLHNAALRPAMAASGATSWIDVLRTERSRPGSQAAQITPLSVLAWHDQDDVMLVTYHETSARDAHPRLKRQYWLRRDNTWRIVFDGAVG